MVCESVSRMLRSTLTIAVLALSSPATLGQELGGMTDLVSPDAPGTHIMTFIADLKAGEEFPPHFHGGEGIVFVMQGSLAVIGLDGTMTTYSAGETFAEPAGVVLGAKVSDDGPSRVVWTIVLPDGADLETPCSGLRCTPMICDSDLHQFHTTHRARAALWTTMLARKSIPAYR